MIIVSGSSNQPLAHDMARLLDSSVAEVDISKFPNGEKRIWIKDKLEGEVAVVVQSFSEPVDEHIIEFTLLVDACRHLGASKIIGVVPWFGYSPQDKSFRDGEPISAHVIAKMLESVGVEHFVTVDIHSSETLKFFKIPTTEISSMPVFTTHFKDLDLKDYVIISVDKGSRRRCQHFADALNLPVTTFNKTRDRHTGAVELEHLEGDVTGKVGISFDDFVSTGSTQIGAAKILKEMGLKAYINCITHPILAGDSAFRILDSHIDRVLTTDTYFLPKHKRVSNIEVLSVAELLAETVRKIN